VTPEQCRVARALLGWPEWKLAHRAGRSLGTLRALEAETRRPRAATLAAIRLVFEEAGVEFTSDDKGGTEVRLAQAANYGQAAPTSPASHRQSPPEWGLPQ
jgi:hypothetical protein